MMGKKSMAANLQKLAADPDAPFDHEVGRLAKQHLRKIKSLSACVIQGDVDAIHDMRVATRRIRALIRLKRDHSKDKALNPLADFAKELGGRLGEVRAEDVLIIAIRKLGSTTALRALDLGVTYRRNARAEQLRELLESKSFVAWRRDVEDEMVDCNEIEQPVREMAPRAIQRAYEPVYSHRYITPGAELSALHALRIDSKKLRYVLEFFSQSTSWDSKSTLSNLVELQDHLGALHDDYLLLREVRSAKTFRKTWNSNELDQLEIAAEKIEVGLQRRQSIATTKGSFLFDEGLVEAIWSKN